MKINDYTYYIVYSWMTSKLELKGLERDLYAVIFGFSQDGESNYHGSIEYLTNLTGYSKQSIIPTLKSLVDKGFIERTEISSAKIMYNVNLQKLVELGVGKENLINSKENLPEINESGKESLQNNKYNNYNIDNSKCIQASSLDFNKEKDNKYMQAKELQANIELVIKHLNEVTGAHFKISSAGNTKVIKARLREGYKVEDFYKVIDYKYQEWGVKPQKFSNGQMSDTYLRPSTLFGNKFDEYLQQACRCQINTTQSVKSIKKLDDRSNNIY